MERLYVSRGICLLPARQDNILEEKASVLNHSQVTILLNAMGLINGFKNNGAMSSGVWSLQDTLHLSFSDCREICDRSAAQNLLVLELNEPLMSWSMRVRREFQMDI